MAKPKVIQREEPIVGIDHALTVSNGSTLSIDHRHNSDVAGKQLPEPVQDRWVYVLSLHLAGYSNKQVADLAGYEVPTVSRILNDPRMVALRQRMLEDNWKEFEALQARVISTIRQKLSSDDEGVQLAAVNIWLKAAKKYGAQLGSVNVTAEDVVLQIMNGNINAK